MKNNKPITRLDEEFIRDCLSARTISTDPNNLDENLLRASVLVPIFYQNSEWHLLFTKRAESLQDHKGQIAFPGGGFEEQDRSLIQTAMREACEEIGLCDSNINVLGILDEYVTVSGYVVTPVVARIIWPFEHRISYSEVSKIIHIPLRWLMDKQNSREHFMILPDGRREFIVFFNLYEGELLWGVTARITLNFLKSLHLY